METLAQELVKTNSVSMISKIYDQYLDVIALEPSLFTLNIKDSFMLYNEPSLSEAHIRYHILHRCTKLFVANAVVSWLMH